MIEQRDQLIEHGDDYDGIKEFDNPLPNWFLYMFYGTVVFSFWYFAYYSGKSWALTKNSGVSYNLAWSGAVLQMAVNSEEAAKEAAPFIQPEGDDLVAFLKNPSHIAKGESMFKANCAACHGENGQGIVGPNLVDPFWIHGGAPEQIEHSIAGGYVAKGMPSWGPVLGLEKVHWLTAYVMSIQGKEVLNPKPPQGDKYP